jgi:predicted negative regulator of RcsB-dependent stress response
MLPFLILGLVLLALIFVLGWQQWQQHCRRQTLIRLLDLADAVEALLDRTQKRMTSLRTLVDRVPTDIAAIAQASLDSSLPIREAKRDVLQHRLWIQKNGGFASQAELDEACAALERVLSRLGGQLEELEKAGADLASLTEAATEAARREPPTLRRPSDA